MTRLTERDRLILSLLALGLTNRAIGLRLGLKENSVKKYLSTMFMRFGCTNRLTLLTKAQRNGWIATSPKSLTLETLQALLAASPVGEFARAILASNRERLMDARHLSVAHQPEPA